MFLFYTSFALLPYLPLIISDERVSGVTLEETYTVHKRRTQRGVRGRVQREPHRTLGVRHHAATPRALAAALTHAGVVSIPALRHGSFSLRHLPALLQFAWLR